MKFYQEKSLNTHTIRGGLIFRVVAVSLIIGFAMMTAFGGMLLQSDVSPTSSEYPQAAPLKQRIN